MNVRVLVNAACALVALSLPLSAAVGSSGCGQTACLQWPAEKGVCPSQGDARLAFGGCNDIVTVDGEATQAEGLCCYPITKTSNGINCVDFGSSGEGPPPPDFASSSTGPVSFCDNTGFCGDTFSGCAGCAVKAACSSLFDACLQEQDCDELRTCIDSCALGDFDCKGTCLGGHPAGQQTYGIYATCVFCNNCPSDCSPNTDLCSFLPESSASVSTTTGVGGMSGVGGMMSGTGGAGGMSGTGGKGGSGGAGGMSGTGGAGGKGGGG